MWRVVLVGYLILAACSGEMQGLVQSPTGQPAGAARAEWQGDGFGGATITVYMPDGEVFQGGATSVETTSTTSGWAGGTSLYATQKVGSGEGVATLLSDEGHSMQCLFRGDATTHGVGQCRVSDGRVVDLTW